MTYAVRTAIAGEPGGRQWRAHAYRRREDSSPEDGSLTPEELKIWEGIVRNYDKAPHIGASALTLTEVTTGIIVLEGTIVSDAGPPDQPDEADRGTALIAAGLQLRTPGTSLSASDLAYLGPPVANPGPITPAQETFLVELIDGHWWSRAS